MSAVQAGADKRTVILHASESISWASCVSISRSLKTAYRRAVKDPFFAPYTDSNDIPGNLRLAKLINEYSPENLIFLDHIPHPVSCLHALKSVSGTKPLPALSFHVYGDFNICSRAWLGVEKVLGPNARARFICASEKQQAHVKQFLKTMAGEKNLELLPFPVATEKFKYDSKSRAGVRKKLGMADDDFIFLFVGRLSLQKNILLMIESFQRVAAINGNARLMLLGSEDDIGAPLHGIGCQMGSYGQAIDEAVRALPPTIRKRVHFLGSVASDELPEFYSAADVFLSLSLHHDEDYGMAPAEALCCGLPVCLTDWGGFSGHPKTADDGMLIPVSQRAKRLEIDKDYLHARLLSCMNYRSDHKDKERRSRINRDRYSVEKCSTSIQELASRRPAKFAGFSSQMSELSFLNTVHDGAPFSANDLATRQFYARTYAHYIKKTEIR